MQLSTYQQMRYEQLQYACAVAAAKSMDSTSGKICGCRAGVQQGAVIFRASFERVEICACGERTERMSPEQGAIAALGKMNRLKEASTLDLLHVDVASGVLCDTDPRASIEGALLIYGYKFRGIWFYLQDTFRFIPAAEFYRISKIAGSVSLD